jgi:hypothetical protein
MSAHPVPNNGRVIDFEQPHLTEKLVEQNKLIRKEKKTKAHLRAANPQMAANIGH